MPKKDIVPGHATIKDLAYWINERHNIYVRRASGMPKPWTDDEIFQRYKFTNAFRQLDKGTIALGRMIFNEGEDNLPLLAWNIIWYRLFNWYKHAYDGGWCSSYKQLQNYIYDCNMNRRQIFTSAHMTTGVSGEHKFETYLRAAKIAWDKRRIVVNECSTMENAFKCLCSFYMVGKFVAYEIVCDFRFTELLQDATDINTWANPGPGAKRGLRRLGMPETLDSMIQLAAVLQVGNYLDDHIYNCEWPFELREVEHSLCEFDKYQRVKTGVGRPRQKYNGY
jgi:hypothetical protein